MVGTGGLRAGWRLLAAAALITTGVVAGAVSAWSPAQAATLTINLFPGPDNVEYGQPLGTYAALSADPQGGTVTFLFNDQSVSGCTDLPAGTGAIYCNYRWLPPGTYEVEALFSGSPTYDPALSHTDQQRVYRANTAITYTGPTSTQRGQPFEVSADMETSFMGEEIVGEPVTFSFAGGDSCTDMTDAAGRALCSIDMPASSATLTITYAGSIGYAEETITAAITAVGGPTTTSLNASPQNGPVGTSIHLSVAVDPSQASGTVTIRNGPTPIAGCSNLPLAGGAASCDTTGLPAGTNVLTAVYGGDTLFDGSTSPPTNVVLSKRAVELTPGGDPTGTVGTPYQLSATLHDVTLDVPAPGQTIVFALGGDQCTGNTGANGIAGCTVTPTHAGNASATYTYEGSATYLADSASRPIVILPAATTTTASSTGGQYLAPVAIDAVVSPTDGAGTVDFFDGATPINGCADLPLALSGGEWTARCTTSALTVGTHPVTAVYAGSANYIGSTSPVTNVNVAPAATSTVVSGPATAVYTTPATFTATVTPPPGGGTVDFSVAGGPIAGCEAVPLADVGGTWQASCSSPLPVGPQTVTAAYSGTASYASSSGSAAVIVAKAPTSLVYTGPTSPPDTAAVGTPVTVAAVLTIMGTTPLDGQVVTFRHSADLDAWCTATTDEAGIATCELTATRATDHGELNVSFAGTTEYEPSSDEDPLDVAPAATTTSVAAPAPTPFGSPVTVTASVAPTDGTGAVAFAVGGEAIPGCEAVSLTPIAPHEATCTTATLPAGTVTVVATYSGSPDYLTSNGSTTVQIVPASTTAVYTGDTTGTVGAPLTLSGGLEATVGGGSLPLGSQTVTFTLADLSCTAITAPDGSASCNVTPDVVAQSGAVTIAFAGTAEFAAATAQGTVAIGPASSATALAGPAGSLYSVPATFVATVGPTNGGTVAFRADGAPIAGCDAVPLAVHGGAWQASCTTTSLATGTHEVSAAFSGTADYLPSAATPVSVSVGVAPTSLTYTGPATATAGEPITVSARLVVDQSGPSSASVGAGAVALAAAPMAADDVPVVGQMLTFQLVDVSCTATTDATGSASCTLTPTASASSSELRITFAGGDGFAAAEEVVAVAVAAAPIPQATPAPTTPTTAPTPVTLPATGGNGTPVGQLAAILLAAGLVALVVATRTRRTAARP